MGTEKFRPKARIIHTLGSELIKDSYAAVIELVKNSYDADATLVEIKFYKLNDPEKSYISITDNGHGMSYDRVKNVWMIPGTNDKLNNSLSKKERKLLGAKGIGRLAASRLGNILILNTTDENKNTTSLKLNWLEFRKDKYLDELFFDIYTSRENVSTGTEIIIKDVSPEWKDQKTIEDLRKELRKLLSPVSKWKEDFEIFLDLKDSGIENLDDLHGEIQPFPILDYFDYRLYGKINKNGSAELKLQNGVDNKIPQLNFNFKLERSTYYNCGEIILDLRVFDLDPESISELVNRSNLKSNSGEYIGKREARNLLRELSGVSIYRHGFRIRPYGDPGYDWLQLDKDRVQNPSMRIGSDQIAGYVSIEDENISGLREKSSREGLFENDSYNILLYAVKECLEKLEIERFEFRRNTGRGRNADKITETLDNLFDLSKIENSINKTLKENNVSQDAIVAIKNILNKEREQKLKDYQKIQEIISRYEGQVTLGKIVGVLMHEGRKPLKYVQEQSGRIKKWIDYLLKMNLTLPNDSLFTKEEILIRLEGLIKESTLLIDLFKKVDPLAVRKRTLSYNNNINDIIERTLILFENNLKENNIRVKKNYKHHFYFRGAEFDIQIALTNLIDNSIYWLSTTKSTDKFIKFDLFYEENLLILNVIDNGPGIKDEYIDLLFEPGFSTKRRGTGLGLSIAGEAIARNEGKIYLFNNQKGASFRIELIKGNAK